MSREYFLCLNDGPVCNYLAVKPFFCYQWRSYRSCVACPARSVLCHRARHRSMSIKYVAAISRLFPELNRRALNCLTHAMSGEAVSKISLTRTYHGQVAPSQPWHFRLEANCPTQKTCFRFFLHLTSTLQWSPFELLTRVSGAMNLNLQFKALLWRPWR